MNYNRESLPAAGQAATFPVWMQGHSDPYDVGSQPVKEKNKNNRTRACATRLEIL